MCTTYHARDRPPLNKLHDGHLNTTARLIVHTHQKPVHYARTNSHIGSCTLQWQLIPNLESHASMVVQCIVVRSVAVFSGNAKNWPFTETKPPKLTRFITLMTLTTV
jgi:hypothetical protein